MSDHQADQARKSMIDSVKGRAKEIAGAVIGNDSLTAEGQLERAQAKERKEAGRAQAIAGAEASEAEAQATEAKLEAAQRRVEANDQAIVTENRIRAEQAAQKRSAEEAGNQAAARAQATAEIDTQRDIIEAKANEQHDIRSASRDFNEAALDAQTKLSDADRKQAQAEQMRAKADDLTGNADLP
jgi:uncharacterized protein YjbJ (UPF0337 family)